LGAPLRNKLVNGAKKWKKPQKNGPRGRLGAKKWNFWLLTRSFGPLLKKARRIFPNWVLFKVVQERTSGAYLLRAAWLDEAQR